MSITQKALAERLGLSRQMVGRSLRGSTNVDDAIRHRVLTTAKELGYTAHSNLDARNMIARRYGRKTRKNSVAVLMPAYSGCPIRKVPYYVPILDGIEMEANERVVDLSLHSLPDGDVPRYVSDFLVDGVIAFTTTPERNQWIIGNNLPVVFIDGRHDGLDTIYSDHVSGIALCTQHLIDLGHRKIAYFSQKVTGGYPTSSERFDSFVKTMAQNGLAVNPELIWRDQCLRMQRDTAAEAMTEILALGREFTAIVCYNDLLAMGVVDALRQAGRRVPEDVSVTGYDDVTGGYGFDPEITSVAFDREELGRQSMRMLYTAVEAVLADPATRPAASEAILPVNLAVHRSTAPVMR